MTARKVTVYCPRHKVSHAFTALEAEDLIVGLAVDRTDAATAPGDERQHSGDDPHYVHSFWCPREDLELFRDMEMYGESLDQARAQRRQTVTEGKIE